MGENEINKIKEMIVRGMFDEALESLQLLAQRYPNNNSILPLVRDVSNYKKDEDVILRYIERDNYKMACDRLRKLTKIARESSKLRILKCKCLIYTDKLADAFMVYSKLNQNAGENDLQLLNSMIAYYKGDLDTAVSICEKIEDSDKASSFLNHLVDLKNDLDSGETEEKQKNYKKAQMFYCKAIELCDLKSNGFCLNKILVVKALIRRARVNAILHANIDVMADSHRAGELLEKIKEDKLDVLIDRKLMAYLGAHVNVGLANGNVRLKATSMPCEFDSALDKCQDYKDLQQDVFDAISEFEENHKVVYVGSEKYQKLFESILPSESIVKHCFDGVQSSEMKVELALQKITRLPVDSDSKEVERVSNYIVKRFDIGKFENQTELHTMAKEILKFFDKSNSSEATTSLSELYEKLKSMELADIINYFQIKMPEKANDKTRSNKLRIFAAKKFHPGV
ncbi:hypothetical protein CHUAL_007078 [Chamberlinius hualienensis]